MGKYFFFLGNTHFFNILFYLKFEFFCLFRFLWEILFSLYNSYLDIIKFVSKGHEGEKLFVVIICQTKTTVFTDCAYCVLIVPQFICWCSNIVPDLFFTFKKFKKLVSLMYNIPQWVFVVKMWFPWTCALFHKSHSGFRKARTVSFPGILI